MTDRVASQSTVTLSLKTSSRALKYAEVKEGRGSNIMGKKNLKV